MLSISATRNAIERWLKLELIEQPRKVIAGHPVYMWLTRRGIAQLDLPFAYYVPKPSTIKHIYAVNAIRLQFEKSDLPIKWYSARVIGRLTDLRPIPDAEIRQPDGTVAIKIIARPELLDITLHDEVLTIESLLERYAKVWCFSLPGSLEAIRQHFADVKPEMYSRIAFYELQAEKQMKKQH